MTEASKSPSFIRPDNFLRSVGLKSGETFVHLGCGAGFYLIPAAQIVGRQGQVIGVDIRRDMLSEAESRAAHSDVAAIVRTVHADLENSQFPIASGIADWTLVANVLYQAKPSEVLAKAKQVTKKGGHIVIIDWDIAASPLGPPVSDRVSPQTVIAILDNLKLKLVKQFRPSPYHYGFVMQTTSA